MVCYLFTRVYGGFESNFKWVFKKYFQQWAWAEKIAKNYLRLQFIHESNLNLEEYATKFKEK